MNYNSHFSADDDAVPFSFPENWMGMSESVDTLSPLVPSKRGGRGRISKRNISADPRETAIGMLLRAASNRFAAVERFAIDSDAQKFYKIAEIYSSLKEINSFKVDDLKTYIADRHEVVIKNSIGKSFPIEPTQQSLPIGGDFAPSERLVSFWLKGASALLSDRADKLASEVVDFTVSSSEKTAFSSMLRDLLVTLAQDARYDGLKYAVLLRRMEFPALLQVKLCDKFFIVPADAGAFLVLLARELDSALRSGVDISGAWGRIRSTASDDWYFDLSPPRRKNLPGFSKSVEVE